MLRGEVWLTDFGPATDSRQSGRRPAIIVQNNPLNRSERYSLTIVVPCTTRLRETIPSRATLEPDRANGLTGRTDAIGENVQLVPKTALVRRLGILSPEDLARVETALLAALAIKPRA